jgi:hypothetical protein
MARQDTVAGIYNYPVPLTSYASITETVLLAPFSTGYYPGYPSPSTPLSTSTYPVVLPVGIAPDVAGGEFDGHAFEVKLTGTVTGASTCTFLIKLYQVTNAVLTSGTTSATYATLLTHPPSGTGIRALVGSSAVTLSSTVKTNFSLVAPFIWDSVSGQLNFSNAPVFYEIGATATPTVTNASTSSIGASDLNFLPSFTWGTAFGGSLVLSEFVINRL